jgi:alpha-D-ribose 1-methylphosphonate 5-triphosphate synthase subunit PhnH
MDGRCVDGAAALAGGFADRPVEAAHAFRAALGAMARPGTVHRVRGARPPAPLSPAAGALALTLADGDTPLWLAPSLDHEAVRAWIAFHAGAPFGPPGEARFAFGRWDELPLDAFAVGTPEYPDRSATLVVEVDAIGRAHRLTGPGIETEAWLTVLDPGFFRANRARFPLGLDVFLACGDRLAALPRAVLVDDPGRVDSAGRPAGGA